MASKFRLRRRIRRVGAQAAEHYLLALLAVVGSGAVWIGYLYFQGDKASFWSNVLAGAFTNLWTFVVLYVVFIRQGVTLPGQSANSGMGALIGFYSRHEDVNWQAAIRGARRVDIVVHYYNRWVREQSEAFTSLFQRGGRVRLVMADPEVPETLACVNRHFFPRLTQQQLIDKIEETDGRLEEAKDAAASRKATLETYYYPEPLHYSFVLIDGRFMYLSVYEQDRGPVIRSSVFEFDLLLDGALDDYWRNNLNHFIRSSRRVR